MHYWVLEAHYPTLYTDPCDKCGLHRQLSRNEFVNNRRWTVDRRESIGEGEFNGKKGVFYIETERGETYYKEHIMFDAHEDTFPTEEAAQAEADSRNEKAQETDPKSVNSHWRGGK